MYIYLYSEMMKMKIKKFEEAIEKDDFAVGDSFWIGQQRSSKSDRFRRDWNRSLEAYSNHCKEVDEKMETDTKERLNSYLELLEEISEKTSDERTALSLLQEISKDRRMEQIREEKRDNNNDAVTIKQKRFMKKLGIDCPKEITRKDASVLINEELEKLNGVGE
jgi:hypothetical protein